MPNHAGARIADDLRASGFKTQVLDDAVWTVLSPRVKVMSLCDYNQDTVLLIDVDGHLLINLNDSSHEAFFWKRTVKRIVKAYEKSFLLKIAGYGDANMINYHDENGIRIPRMSWPNISRPIDGAHRCAIFCTCWRPAAHLGSVRGYGSIRNSSMPP